MFFFWPLTILTILVAVSTFTLNRDETLGIRTRCDVAASCKTEQRRWYDYSWLCCEDGNAWPQAHILNPFGLALFFGSPLFSFAIPFYWEAFEATLVMSFDSFLGLFQASEDQFETAAGSIVGDAQLNGVMGVLLAFILSSATGWPGLIWFAFEREKGTALGYKYTSQYMSGTTLAKYLVLASLWAVTFSLNNFRYVVDESRSLYFNYGVILSFAVHSILLLVIMPIALRPTDLRGGDISKMYGRIKWLWWFVVFFIDLSGLGPHVLPNDWFGAWLAWILLLVFFVLLNRAKKSRVRLRD